jgi:amino acid transporter
MAGVLGVFFFFFFLPYALSIAELGSAFPQEGGPYVWTRLAFGRPLAAAPLGQLVAAHVCFPALPGCRLAGSLLFGGPRERLTSHATHAL